MSTQTVTGTQINVVRLANIAYAVFGSVAVGVLILGATQMVAGNADNGIRYVIAAMVAAVIATVALAVEHCIES